MDLFRRIFFAAALAGLIAGGALTAIHVLAVVPLIEKAEIYEQAAEQKKIQAVGQVQRPATQAHDHDQAWEPEGVQRTLFTGLFDVLAGIGFGLLLAAGYALRGETDARRGLIWGVGGFAAFSLAPALGLPPELPGTEAADLMARQVWWLSTVALTGVGLSMTAFTSHWLLRLAGLALIALPHVVGAPYPAEPGSVAPAELQRQFAIASLSANAVFWVVLGVGTGYFFQRFGPPNPDS
ncbi:MAG: cobalt transporter [Alphaproteobacteria bacterium]|nr:cobalt transporter [Alphaproteobacteria bacterium]